MKNVLEFFYNFSVYRQTNFDLELILRSGHNMCRRVWSVLRAGPLLPMRRLLDLHLQAFYDSSNFFKKDEVWIRRQYCSRPQVQWIWRKV